MFLYLFSPSVSIPQGYIAVLLLLAFWFVVHRKMTRQRTECVGGWMGLCMRGCSNDLHCPPPSLYPLPPLSLHPSSSTSLPSSLLVPSSQGGAVFREEKGALFPGVTRQEAEQSLWTFLKYSVNHAFDYVGTEVCM